MEKLLFEVQERTSEVRSDKQVFQAKKVLQEYAQNQKVLVLTDQDRRVIASCVLSCGKKNSKYRHTLFIEDLFTNVTEQDIVPLALYGAFREGRKWGLKNYVLGTPAFSMKELALEALKESDWLDKAMLTLYNSQTQSYQNLIRPLFIQEIVATVETWIESFYACQWGTLVKEERLTREQYVRYLYDVYCFVAQTTQHLARAIEISPNLELRNHYIAHLKGELNHEVWIENDLRALGEDTEYLAKAYRPNLHTRQFMAMQETIVKFYRDPVTFLACPLAAEGTAAMMTEGFIKSLENCISKWGVARPLKAMTFTKSHMITDAGTNGKDGHWMLTVKMVGKYVETEAQLQRFLDFLHAIMDSYRKGVDQSIEDACLWEMGSAT